jgi:hypothetical protein
MEDRIELNGVWYVREDSVIDKTTPVEVDPTYYIGAVVETDTACFEFSVLTNEKNVMRNDTQSITYTKKVGDRKDWVEDILDNPSWLRDLAERGDYNISEPELPTGRDKEVLVIFLRELIYKGML